MVLRTGILLNRSSISLRIRLPKKDSDKPPTMVIKINEIIISNPGISNGR